MQHLFQQHFPENTSQIFIASSPGRLDVMGGIADYSGSLVLQMPIREQTSVALALRNDGIIQVITLSEKKHHLFRVDWGIFLKNGEIDYHYSNKIFNKLSGGDWASYVIGCLLVLTKEKGIEVTGMDILVSSEVPIGKGVSSSAALEMATMKALVQAFNLTSAGTELPLLAQKVENLIVGAPCGLMDQLASYLGERGSLLPILCQPDIVSPLIVLPKNVHFIGIDSGLRHFVGGASYGDVRTAAFMGYSIIASRNAFELANLKSIPRENLPFQGFLANISVEEFNNQYLNHLPEHIKGQDYLHFCSTILDHITEVNPENTYAVKQATTHPVYENARVQRFQELLQSYSENNENPLFLKLMGELMYQSHESYSACGLGSILTDELVKMAKEEEGKGIFGAKITGGGSGGTVCFLCEGDEGVETAHRVRHEYQIKNGVDVAFFE